MGRTLHYKMLGDQLPTDTQENKLINLSESYNTKFNWTCENVWLSSVDYYPNWNFFPKDIEVEKVWDRINARYDRYLRQGLSRTEIIKKMDEDGLVYMDKKESLSGFTKTGGNELNAHTVIYFIAEASRILPKRIFTLYDEGDALYCSLLIKNGRAKPDLKSMESSLEYWRDKDYLHDDGLYDVTNAEVYYKSLFKLKPSWSSISDFIRPMTKSGKPKQAKTQVLELNEISSLHDLLDDFLANERKETEKFYDDVKQFPELEMNK